ncbi:MAG: hypothetical protein KF718_25180 [Polyangiaceae bacterium]|nr:hypothetical protein [Polyangiaceae bacterium]
MAHGRCWWSDARAVPVLAAAACSASPAAPVEQSPRPTVHGSAAAPAAVSAAPAVIAAQLPPSQLEPDGNDERPTPAVALPEKPRFARLGRHWAALHKVCDLAAHGGALFMAHATSPLAFTGATVTRYDPRQREAFALAFDWNRPGEPERGGAGGQGFLRLRIIDGRLHVPDADPPYLGLGVAFGVEGYVFTSDERGRFERVARPGHRPPRAPTEARGGSIVLPGALHVFDVIRFRGKRYASSGAAVPPKVTATHSPGVLFVEGGHSSRWDASYSYPGASGEAAARLSYMVRFRDRLYVAISPLYGLDRHDYVVLAPPRDETALTLEHARAVRGTVSGGAHTLRWYADRGRLYWITLGAGGGELRVTEDGDTWTRVELPQDAGRPTDVLRVGERLLVMAERALLELSAAGAQVVARVEEQKSPFSLDDTYCAAPLVVFDGKVMIGGQRRGDLWALVESG